MKGEITDEVAARRVHRLLADQRRRNLLMQLIDNGGGNLEHLVRGIATRERSESSETITEEVRERIAISLVHNHLPRLVDHGLVEYDQRSGDIALTDRFATLEPVIQQFSDGETGTQTSLERSAQKADFQATAGQ